MVEVDACGSREPLRSSSVDAASLLGGAAAESSHLSVRGALSGAAAWWIERPSSATAVMINRAFDTLPTLAYGARHPLPMS